MQIEDRLKRMKADYDGIRVPNLLRENGWEDLEAHLNEQENVSYIRYWKVAAFTALILILVAGGTVFASQYAKPGDTLYAVKLASENVFHNVSHDNKGNTQLNQPPVRRKPSPTPAVKAAQTAIPTPTTSQKHKEENDETKQSTTQVINNQGSTKTAQNESENHAPIQPQTQQQSNNGASNENGNNAHANGNSGNGQSNNSQKSDTEASHSDNGASHSQDNGKNK